MTIANARVVCPALADVHAHRHDRTAADPDDSRLEESAGDLSTRPAADGGAWLFEAVPARSSGSLAEHENVDRVV
jgi:hypothetical protein